MPPPVFQRQSELIAADAWFAGAAGQAVLASEAGCVAAGLQQRPGQVALWLGTANAAPLAAEQGAVPLRLHPQRGVFTGGLQCGLPLPLASETCAVVIVQHPETSACAPGALLEECARVLLPGGWLWLLAFNPLSPYRWRWRGQGLRVHEPVTWRKRLRAAGLAPDSLTQGVGPVWEVGPDPRLQDGVGLRAAFLLRAEKRRLPLTPQRKSQLHLQAGTPA